MFLVPVQLLFWLFVLGVLVTGFEMVASLRPPACPRCAHCQALEEEERRRQAELRDSLANRFGIRDPKDDRRPR